MTPAGWPEVLEHAKRLGAVPLKTLARQAPMGERAVWSAPNLRVDVGRQCIDPAAEQALLDFAAHRRLAASISKLFSGEIVNSSERRPALHWALRGGVAAPDAARGMLAEAARASAFAADVRAGRLGYMPRTILHIGIGGSDLGPRLVWDALRDYASGGPEIRFCANVDPDDFREATAGLRQAETLVIVVSKSFKTPETASNAQLAREWLLSALPAEQLDAHLAAVSSAPDRAKAWGAAADRIFAMDEAVGGRYSVWSPVGLSLQIALPEGVWERFLAGAGAMDAHFASAPLADNLPARLALLDVWLHTAFGLPTRSVLAYAHRLRRLPDFLQQLEMESNGKSAADTPEGMLSPTAPVTWGSVGTLGQHSFHQLLHQGLRDMAVEFVAALDAGGDDSTRGRALMANALAQGEAMLVGRSADEAFAALTASGMPEEAARAQARHMHMAGDHGSITVLLDSASPECVGALLSLYEHRTFAAGVLWGVNPFDQWGVERGKVLAEELDAALAGAPLGERDPATQRLVAFASARFKTA